jgi:two-component system phosphate regulon sensor histidine kinase PhoR
VARGKLLAILSFSSALLGLACLLVSARAVIQLSDSSAAAFVGVVFLMCSGIAGMLTVASFRTNCRKLTALIEKFTEQRRLGHLSAESAELLPLVSSMNEMLELAENAVNDATLKLKELEIQLKVAQAQRQHAEAILFSISDAVLVTDPFDDLVLANEAAGKVLQFDVATSSRKPVDQIVRDQKVIDLIREMRESRSTTGRRIVEHQLDVGGRPHTFKITLSSVTDQSSEPAGVVAVLHDMTREKEVAEMKNDFVSNVSHELRTPLASIKAYVEMLIDGEAQNEKTQHEFYEVIQNEANRLSRLIDNILNISRIESGLTKVSKSPQSLMVILKEAIEVISPQARAKQIRVKEELTPLFYQTDADKDMLYQAVLNLLSNAVKYTPEGGTITVQTVVDETKRTVLTKIIDTGVGIPPKDLPFVFDKFYRAESNNRMAKGTGLGLSLVKHIVESVHQGRIFVESTVGKGSCFGFELSLSD